FYPSDPKTSFASIIFQELPTKTEPDSPVKALTELSAIFIKVWERCLQEEFFLPMRELVALLSFTLQLHSVSIIPALVEKLLPIAQATLHVIDDIRNACSGPGAGDTELQNLYAHLDSTAVVALLGFCASVCATSSGVARAAFWRELPMETVLLVIGAKQPLPDIVGMLEMLTTSVLPGTIGPLGSGEPSVVTDRLLDKVSNFLVRNPAAARTPSQRHAVVASALRTLISFTADEVVARQMAAHKFVVTHAISALSRSVEELYDQELSATTLRRPRVSSLDEALAAADDPDSDPWNLCTVISLATLLLHGIVLDPRTADLVGLEGRFKAWPLGGRRYLIALCRLTFADEEAVLEGGVDSDTVERAHELLEMAVSVEGGKDVEMLFSSPGY
ncbi:DUF3636 domain-containing protein, partial [Candidatus Bathyarchaeota archaeon]|nr:DUF3636 domain-containing protein [Candidatus Bathyarchaeota archaeon]